MKFDLLLKEVIYRQRDKQNRQSDRGSKNFFLHASLGGVSTACLPECSAQPSSSALLQKHQSDNRARNYDLNDGDNICHRIELMIIIIKVVAISGQIPWICNSKTKISASQIIDISITKLNKFKVKMRKGKDRIFKIGAMAKFNKAMQNPANVKTLHAPEYSTPGINRAAIYSAKPLPMVYMINFASILLYSIRLLKFDKWPAKG